MATVGIKVLICTFAATDELSCQLLTSILVMPPNAGTTVDILTTHGKNLVVPGNSI